MATEMIKESKLRVSYEVGLSEGGKPIFKTKTYSNVVETATAEQLYQVAQDLASLSTYPMSEVEKNDSYEILG
jgi:hypothetical protein